MSKLDDKIKSHENYCKAPYKPHELHNYLSNENFKHHIKALFLELIGDDEPRPESGAERNGTAQAVRRAGNKVKTELRKKVEEL